MKRIDIYILTFSGFAVFFAAVFAVCLAVVESIQKYSNIVTADANAAENWTIVQKLDGGLQVLDTTSGRLCFILNNPDISPSLCSKPKLY